MDPTLVMGAMGAIGQGLAGGPSSASSGFGSIGNQLDGSGWTVSTGRGSVGSGATITKPGDFMGQAGTSSSSPLMAAGFDGSGLEGVAMLLLIGAVAWKLLAR